MRKKIRRLRLIIITKGNWEYVESILYWLLKGTCEKERYDIDVLDYGKETKVNVAVNNYLLDGYKRLTYHKLDNTKYMDISKIWDYVEEMQFENDYIWPIRDLTIPDYKKVSQAVRIAEKIDADIITFRTNCSEVDYGFKTKRYDSVCENLLPSLLEFGNTIVSNRMCKSFGEVKPCEGSFKLYNKVTNLLKNEKKIETLECEHSLFAINNDVSMIKYFGNSSVDKWLKEYHELYFMNSEGNEKEVSLLSGLFSRENIVKYRLNKRIGNRGLLCRQLDEMGLRVPHLRMIMYTPKIGLRIVWRKRESFLLRVWRKFEYAKQEIRKENDNATVRGKN